MLRVTSPHNGRLREALRLLASSRERRKSGRCILEGMHLVEVYRARLGAPELLVVSDEALLHPEVRSLAESLPESAVIAVPSLLLAEHTALPPEVGVLAVVPAPRACPSRDSRFCLLLEDVQDPGNVGSMLRTAAAAGCDQVLLSKACAFAWSPKVLRAGQGAHFLTRIAEDVDLGAWLANFRSQGGHAMATLARGGASLYATPLAQPLAVVIGNEGAGLAAETARACDLSVTIPLASGSESLNAAAAAAIVLFEARRQLGAG
jgi:RNA methyltransferase, TrmH family